MSTALEVVDGHQVPKGSSLATSEQELKEAMINQFEAFYRQGVVLKRIKDKREFADANYSSFDDYMKERQPLGIGRTHAWQLIAACQIRGLLPDSAMAESPWTERSIRPLTNSKFSPADVKRLGKKIATRVRKGELLSAKLVKEICDDDLGTERKRKAKQLEESDSPADILKGMARDVRIWKKSLEQVPATFWEDAERDSPGCCEKLSKALSDLASYLRS